MWSLCNTATFVIQPHTRVPKSLPLLGVQIGPHNAANLSTGTSLVPCVDKLLPHDHSNALKITETCKIKITMADDQNEFTPSLRTKEFTL